MSNCVRSRSGLRNRGDDRPRSPSTCVFVRCAKSIQIITRPPVSSISIGSIGSPVPAVARNQLPSAHGPTLDRNQRRCSRYRPSHREDSSRDRAPAPCLACSPKEANHPKVDNQPTMVPWLRSREITTARIGARRPMIVVPTANRGNCRDRCRAVAAPMTGEWPCSRAAAVPPHIRIREPFQLCRQSSQAARRADPCPPGGGAMVARSSRMSHGIESSPVRRGAMGSPRADLRIKPSSRCRLVRSPYRSWPLDGNAAERAS